MNGGNPASTERVVRNLELSAEKYLMDEQFKSMEDLICHPLFHATKNCLENFNLANEVKSLNKTISAPYLTSHCNVATNLRFVGLANFYSYTVDKVKPYLFDKPHKGISRVLQGFEIVLLTILVRDILMLGG